MSVLRRRRKAMQRQNAWRCQGCLRQARLRWLRGPDEIRSGFCDECRAAEAEIPTSSVV